MNWLCSLKLVGWFKLFCVARGTWTSRSRGSSHRPWRVPSFALQCQSTSLCGFIQLTCVQASVKLSFLLRQSNSWKVSFDQNPFFSMTYLICRLSRTWMSSWSPWRCPWRATCRRLSRLCTPQLKVQTSYPTPTWRRVFVWRLVVCGHLCHIR